MTLDTIRDYLHNQPFQPFTAGLVDGRSLAVPHPDFVAFTRRQVIITNPQSEAFSVVDRLLPAFFEPQFRGTRYT